MVCPLFEGDKSVSTFQPMSGPPGAIFYWDYKEVCKAMGKKKLVVECLGHGGGIMLDPSDGNTNFKVRVEGESEYVLVDCGPETMRSLVVNQDLPDIRGVIVTHCHTDHTGGLASLGWYLLFVAHRGIPVLVSKEAKPMLMGQLAELYQYSPGIAEEMANPTPELAWLREGGLHVTTDPVEFVHKAFPNHPWLSVNLFPVDHGIPSMPCSGVVFAREGMNMVGFTGDTAKQVTDFGPGGMPGLVLHDAQWTGRSEGFTVHCPIDEVLAAYKDWHDTRVLLCHIKSNVRAELPEYSQAFFIPRGTCVTVW